MSTFYSMHRGWMDSPVFKKEPFTEREAWCWMIEMTVYAPEYTVKIKESPVKLKRGQISYSIRYMAKAWGWKYNRTLTFIKKLKKWNMIQSGLQSGQTVITICNYSKYQDVFKNPNQQAIAKAIGGQSQLQSNKKKDKERINNVLKPDFISDELWADFKKLRQGKKAPITATVMAGIIQEAEEAGWTLEEALKEICIRGWQSFKAEWVEKKGKKRRKTSGYQGM